MLRLLALDRLALLFGHAAISTFIAHGLKRCRACVLPRNGISGSDACTRNLDRMNAIVASFCDCLGDIFAQSFKSFAHRHMTVASI
jgi:hypothetical protein